MNGGAGTREDWSDDRSADWINLDRGVNGCERIEAFFSGEAYVPHRHDTYAIGRTLSGVQRFRYRGEVRDGLPGTAMVLHPDEVHDGQAGTEAGFHYRMIYLDPALIQAVLGGHRALPFVSGGISADIRLLDALDGMIMAPAKTADPLQFEDALYDLAQALDAAGGQSANPMRSIDYNAALTARNYIRDALGKPLSLDHLETVTGQDRWTLSRHFRAAFGTSPYRYLTMRRLDHARGAIVNGQPLAETAFEAGFADQAHFTRQFRNAFGLTPAAWRRLIGAPRDHDRSRTRR
ncbi:AraC family transcriptional regulator [Rhizobium rhizosphaerae]|uniref:AraC family transcriptional regulator n=1 Tax=Xaviernesmea rhizosphaerae TaxID=1672749 RepID=A0ABX3PIW4_9HYPH|nr:AraC family transcriptional regulator [Xaviernesmea rhizosphaerae]OQP88332.1 AraC family transcriptional regulator [Xaviernesmea rhizosphaerae]